MMPEDEFRPRVLVVHNAYKLRGGEDAVAEAETNLLVDHGHAVKRYTRHNDELDHIGVASAAIQTLWSARTVDEISELIDRFRPDVIHVHNTFPLISPAIYWTASRMGIPVVQTLHNYRLICPQAMCLRDGRVCVDCVGKLPWRGIARKCYRGSIAQSGVLATMTTLHGVLGTWRRKVSRYIALSEFSRKRFIEGGLPAERITVKPNFSDMPPPPANSPREGALFVGRLSAEKGISVMVEAANGFPDGALRVAGIGPEAARLSGHASISVLGALSKDRVAEEMSRALVLLLPSICFENFPLILVEAYSRGLPAIASRIGALAELVEHGVTGLLFEPGNAEDLAAKLSWARDNPQAMSEMGRRARAHFEANYSPEINFRRLIEIYRSAIAELQAEPGNP